MLKRLAVGHFFTNKRWGFAAKQWKSTTTKPFAEPFAEPAGPRGPPLPPLEPAVSKRTPRTMLHYIHEIQQKYPDAVVMAQVGSFMELYFDQAVKYGPLLNLKVARKQSRSPINGQEFVNMAGFPLPHKEKYERIIVQDLGKTVVTLMQNSKYVLSGGTEEEKRPISRVLTPGTLLAEDFIDRNINNYLAAVYFSGSREVCVTWVDVASGRAKYQIIPNAELGNSLARIGPSEVLFDSQSSSSQLKFGIEAAAQYAPLAAVSRLKFPPIEYFTVRATHSQRYRLDEMPAMARKSFVGLVSYIDDCMPGSPLDIQEPEPFLESMQLDARAREALELTQKKRSSFFSSSMVGPSSASGGAGGSSSGTSTRTSSSSQGSLLSIIRRTRTPSGSRLLQDWIAAPLQDPSKIKERQDKVHFLQQKSRVTISSLQSLLSELPDGPRLLQKLWLPKIDPLDLVAFARSVVTIESIATLLLSLKKLPKDWKQPLESLVSDPLVTARQILDAINIDAIIAGGEKPPNDISSAGAEEVYDDGSQTTTAAALVEPKGTKKIKSKARKSTKTTTTNPRKSPKASSPHTFSPATNRGYQPVLNASVSPRLQALYDRQNGFAQRESQILAKLQKIYGNTVELRWSPSHQFYVHITLNGQNEPEPSRLITRNKSTAYVTDPEWIQLGSERLELSSLLRDEEEKIFHDLRETILTEHLPTMRKLYNLIDEIDVQLSFAVLAVEKRLVRPEVVDDPRVFEIVKGRHITVETGLALGGYSASGFVPNDCNLSSPQQLCMITGPNMGGKSTYIRQSALIALLAHIGSYVPAESAKIGIVDRIFCRIGAGDDLYSGRSTFMMEMLETATILNNATNRSLAILDEVGRGTSGNDGIAIAFASIKHLVLVKQCRTLFATHYGQEIWDLLKKSDMETKITDSIRLLQASLQISSNGEPLFDYELRPGISSSSGGLLIAEMAGFPESALRDAASLIQPK